MHVDALIKSGQSSSKKEAELLVMQQREFILSPLAELDAQVSAVKQQGSSKAVKQVLAAKQWTPRY